MVKEGKCRSGPNVKKTKLQLVFDKLFSRTKMSSSMIILLYFFNLAAGDFNAKCPSVSYCKSRFFVRKKSRLVKALVTRQKVLICERRESFTAVTRAKSKNCVCTHLITACFSARR